MGSNRRKKTLTILLAAILGECAALLLVVFVLTSFGPAGSGNYPVAAGPLHIEENGGILSGDGEYNLPETISGGRETNNETVDETVRASENSAWDIDATIELVKNRVSVREKIRLEAEGANAVVYLPSANKADTVIKKMLYNGKTAVYDRKDTDIHIMDAENGGYLYIEYEILLSDKPEILSYTSDSVLLTNFLAVPAVYKNNAPLPSYSYSLGDPYRYGIYSYRVLLKAPKEFTAYAPGKILETVKGSEKNTVFEAENLRDFPVVLFKNAKVVTVKYGNTDIIHINAEPAKNYSVSAVKQASGLIGPYPFRELFVVAADFPLRGMEFSNMIFISRDCFNDPSTLKRLVYHEILHQWFYGIIGTDQINEPFMDEGLVTYLTSYLCGDRTPSYYGKSFINKSLKDYSSRAEYNQSAYADAAGYFAQLHGKMGNAFFSMLKKIYNEKQYKILYFEDFERYLEEFSGRN